jgi:hypothetical protein
VSSFVWRSIIVEKQPSSHRDYWLRVFCIIIMKLKKTRVFTDKFSTLLIFFYFNRDIWKKRRGVVQQWNRLPLQNEFYATPVLNSNTRSTLPCKLNRCDLFRLRVTDYKFVIIYPVQGHRIHCLYKLFFYSLHVFLFELYIKWKRFLCSIEWYPGVP